jgi:hypothetical protein
VSVTPPMRPHAAEIVRGRRRRQPSRREVPTSMTADPHGYTSRGIGR